MTPPNAERAGRALDRLVRLAARLRAPDGCPWDRKQTVATSAHYVLEEAYEALEALEEDDAAHRREELGDLLFQIVFQAQLAFEAGDFDMAGVIEEVEAKMIRRHPHVFGEETAESAGEVVQLWGEIKAREKAGRRDPPQGLLSGVPLAAPSLLRAQRLGQKAARVDFDWESLPGVREKIDEELGEMDRAADAGERERELGDVLFALAQWARHAGLNAERALRGANARFTRRFELMEGMAKGAGQDLAGLSGPERESLWERAKTILEGRPEPAEEP